MVTAVVHAMDSVDEEDLLEGLGVDSVAACGGIAATG